MSASTTGALLAALAVAGGGMFAALEGTNKEGKEAASAEEEKEDPEQQENTDAGSGYFPKGLTVLDKHSAEALLRNPQQDVVVAVLASGCPVCKVFKIVYQQVAASLADTPIIVALIDGTDYDPIGFTEEESKRVPRIRVYKKNQQVDQKDSGAIFTGRTVGPKDLLTFIHQHTSSLFDLEEALGYVDSSMEDTREALMAQVSQNVDEESKNSMTLRLNSLSPCADKMQNLYIQWTLRDYPEYSKYSETFLAAMKCLRSQENEDFWLDVVDIATDNLRVIDKAQKKEARDQTDSTELDGDDGDDDYVSKDDDDDL